MVGDPFGDVVDACALDDPAVCGIAAVFADFGESDRLVWLGWWRSFGMGSLELILIVDEGSTC